MDAYNLQPCKILLVLSNYGILGYLILLIYRHISSHHDLKSFSFIFHVLCSIWLFFRGIFWISTLTDVTLNWSPAAYYLLYWMPVPVEFVSFLLFPLYFVQIIYPVEWSEYEHLLIPMYAFLICSLLSFQAIFIMVELMSQNEATRHCGHHHECFHMDIKNAFFRAITACCFIILATIQSIYALKLHTVPQIRYDRYLSSSRDQMFYVNCVMVLSFASRSLYQILGVFDIYILPDVPLSEDGDAPLIVFLMFELWDYVPTLLLVHCITSRSVGDDFAAHRNLNINLVSRQLLWGKPASSSLSSSASQYQYQYGSLDDLEEERGTFHGPHNLRHGDAEDPDGQEFPVFGPHREVEMPRVPSRNGSLTKRDNSNDSQSMRDQAAHNIVERFMDPPSLIPAGSALEVKEAARSWQYASTPPGSNPGSYSNTSAAGSIYAYAISHGQRTSATAGLGGLPGMSVSIPTANSNLGKGFRSGSYTSPYGSGSGGGHTPPTTGISGGGAGATLGVSAGSSITSGSVSNCSGIIAYHDKQLRALQQEAAAAAMHSSAHFSSASSDNGEGPSPRAAVTTHSSSYKAYSGVNPHLPPHGQHPRSYSISSVESNRPLKPGYSPSKVHGKSLTRPAPASATNNNNNQSNINGSGIGIDRAVESTLSSASATAHTPVRSASPHGVMTPLTASLDADTTIHLPAEANEWLVEPGTSHHDRAGLLEEYIASAHTQPRYLQEDYKQFQDQQYALNQARQAAALQNSRTPPPPPHSHQSNHSSIQAEAGSSPSGWLHLYIPSPVNGPGVPGGLSNSHGTPSNMSLTPLPPGQYLVPLQMALAVPSPYGGTDQSVGSLEFSNDTSPSLQALSSSAGGSRGFATYQYEEHSQADSGIGMGNLPPVRLGGGGGSGPTSPQPRTMQQPAPRRPNLAGRNLGFETPSPRTQRNAESSLGGSYGSDKMHCDNRVSNSFSPSFIPGIDFAAQDQDRYLMHAQEAYREDLHRRGQEPHSYARTRGNNNNSGGTYNNVSSGSQGRSNPGGSRSALQVSTPERQEVARANALIREDHRDKFGRSF